MKQVLEFEKPLVKTREELDELRRRQNVKPSEKLAAQIVDLEKRFNRLQEEIYAHLTPWQRVQIARHTQRPYMLDYAKLCFDDFVELHGDRHIGDDNAMPGGFATIEGRRVMLI